MGLTQVLVWAARSAAVMTPPVSEAKLTMASARTPL